MNNPTADQHGRRLPRSFAGKLIEAATVIVTAGIFLGLAGAGITALHLRAAAEPQRAPAPPILVETMRANVVDGHTRVSQYTGRIEAARNTSVAFERGGIVVEIGRDEGDLVEAGEVIARLDTSQLETSRLRLEGRLRELAARKKLAELTLGRQERLSGRGWSPDQTRDEAEASVSEIAAAMDQVRAQIAAIDIDLGKSELKAPFSGTIAARSIDDGAVVAAGAAVMTILETGKLQVRIGLPPEVAKNLSRQVDYSVRAGSQRLDAELMAVRPDLESGTRTVTALFKLDGPNIRAPLGDLATLQLETFVRERGAWVPLAALKEGRRGLWTLMAVDVRSGVAVVKPEAVELLHTHDGQAFVRGTFRDGDRILAGGTNRVVAGQRVALAGE